WWAEAYSPKNGWAIGGGEEYKDIAYQDAVESQALYNVLENDVAPCFCERKNGEAPSRWVDMMKASMKMAMECFCSHRMVKTYEDNFYRQAIISSRSILENNAEPAKRFVMQRSRLLSLWKEIRISAPVKETENPLRIGDSFQVTAEIFLGEITPDEVDVEVYYGHIIGLEAVSESKTAPMAVFEDLGGGNWIYECSLECDTSGRFGFTVRVTPRGDDRIKFTPGLISWAS
ncbi:DUF3417 domain-containing protein, partial [Thermodesulfobacteriota bacterium]